MKSCVVFSVSIFDSKKLYVLKEFMDTFDNNFKDSDFYIGINYGSVAEVETLLDTYALNMNTIRLEDENLYCGSDASAYQIALKLLKQKNKKYDVYWFAHTKGAVNIRPIERDMYITELFERKVEIESMFSMYDKLGSYALRGVSKGAAGDEWHSFNHDHDIEICSNRKFDKLQYTHVNWCYIETMYVLNKDSVETFLSVATDKFFNTRIEDKCYFEIIFAWIATRLGYFPYIKNNMCFWGTVNLKDVTKLWIEQNNLDLHNYLSL